MNTLTDEQVEREMANLDTELRAWQPDVATDAGLKADWYLSGLAQMRLEQRRVTFEALRETLAPYRDAGWTWQEVESAGREVFVNEARRA